MSVKEIVISIEQEESNGDEAEARRLVDERTDDFQDGTVEFKVEFN